MTITGINIRLLIIFLVIPLLFIFSNSCSGRKDRKEGNRYSSMDSEMNGERSDYEKYRKTVSMLVIPGNPRPGEAFRVLTAGGGTIVKAQIIVLGPTGRSVSLRSEISEGSPAWRIDDFDGEDSGSYKAMVVSDKKEISSLGFKISENKTTLVMHGVWKIQRGWDISTEQLFSAWINALFQDCDERSSWSYLHEVTQNRNRNFLYNYLSLDEDDPAGGSRVIMQPDCADNPFYLRAYFAWKLGLPFGFHISDRGSLGRNPRTGQWITNETVSSNSNPVLAFNAFLRRVMDGVHSGTARTALENENSDYYPVPLERAALVPGTVFADPYGHTLIIVNWIPQTSGHPGMLLSVDAQPDGTIGLKRFWEGNFLFNTSGVIGNPGFKAFRPIVLKGAVPTLLENKSLTTSSGFVPFSLQQKEMKSEVFYHTMERIINPDRLDPEAALLDLIKALHEQLIVRVASVANGEAYLKAHRGTVIPMPSSAAGIFLAGGQWENFSTPNRDLRLLIAMDAVLNFPDRVARSPEDFKISRLTSPEQVKKKLQSVLAKRVFELSVSYTRTDGSVQNLTLNEILERRDAFEMAYNPNDGPEIRWGAPEKSDELATCRRHAPAGQVETMRSVRTWFQKRLHPPT